MLKAFIVYTSFFICYYARAQQAKQYTFTHFNKLSGLASNSVTNIAQDEKGFMWFATTNGLQRFDGSRFITFESNPNDKFSIPSDHIYQVLMDKKDKLWLVFPNGKIGWFDTRRFVFHEAKVKVRDERILMAEKKLIQDADGNLILNFMALELTTYNPTTNEFSAANNFISLPQNWKLFDIIPDHTRNKYWLGCDSGLVVYNSGTKKMSYRRHNVENDPVIRQYGHINFTSRLFIDSKQRFWFQSWPPLLVGPTLYCYDLKLRTPFLDRHNLWPTVQTYYEIRQQLEQRGGRIWISGVMILAEFDENKRQFETVYNGFLYEQGIQYKTITCLYEDLEQNVWIATDNNGLFLFNPTAQLFKNVRHLNRATNQPGDGGIISFHQTNNNTILVGAWGNGLYRYDTSFNNIPINIEGIAEKNGISVWDIYRRSSGEVWMALQPGILVYNPSTNTSKTYQPPLLENRTSRQLVEDRQGNMWIGTQSRGLLKWTAAKGAVKFEDGFSNFEGIPQTLIYKLHVDSKGFLWVGTIADGVFKIRTADGMIMEHLTKNGVANRELLDNAVPDMVELNDSLMVFASGGLNIYNTRTNTFRYLTTYDGLPSNIIASMAKDKSGQLWLGLLNGLCRVNLEKKSFLHYDRNDGIVNDNFNVGASYLMPDGRMLFGTTNNFVVFHPGDLVMRGTPPDVAITGFELSNQSLPVDSLQQLKKIRLRHDNNSIQIDFASLSYLKKNKISYYYQLEGLDKNWIAAGSQHQAIYNYLPPGNYVFKVRGENPGGVASKNITTLAIRVSPPFWKSWWFYIALILLTIFILYKIDRERVKRSQTLQKVRTQIADNLHEEINITLNKINLLSEMARIKADKDIDRSKEYIDQISEKSHGMIIAMDDILWSINPENDNMEKTLLRMAEFIDALQNRHGASIEIEVDEKVRSVKLDMKSRHEAFIIFKELLRNIVDQTNGSPILIHIDLSRSNLSFKIQSNGYGEHEIIYNELMLAEIRKRAHSIKAILDVLENKKGTFITLQVPVR